MRSHIRIITHSNARARSVALDVSSVGEVTRFTADYLLDEIKIYIDPFN